MRALLVGDQHVADRPPSARTDSYKDDILDKMRWIVNHANKEDVDHLVFLGDMFHIKRPDRNSYRMVQEVAGVLSEAAMPVHLVSGNHDQSNDRVDSISSQPLGTLLLMENVHLLDGYSDDATMFGIPYLDTESPELLQPYLEEYGNDVLICTHQSIFPEKEAPIYEYQSAENWADTFKAPAVAYGHIHSRMKAGAFFEIGGTWFCNNGSISRGSLHEETINRKLAVTIYDSESEGNPFTSVPIPYRPAEEVFLLEEVALQKERDSKVDRFLESLGSSELNYLTTEGILQNARESDLPKSAIIELEDIIENV